MDFKVGDYVIWSSSTTMYEIGDIREGQVFFIDYYDVPYDVDVIYSLIITNRAKVVKGKDIFFKELKSKFSIYD